MLCNDARCEQFKINFNHHSKSYRAATTIDQCPPSFVATILSSASSTNAALNTKFNHGNKFTHVQNGHDSLKPIHLIHVLTSKEKTPLPLFQVLNYFIPIFAHTRGVGKSYNRKFHVDLKVLVDEFRPVLFHTEPQSDPMKRDD